MMRATRLVARRRCGDGGCTTSVGGLLEHSLPPAATDTGDEARVPIDPNADPVVATEACVSAGEASSLAANPIVHDRGDDNGVLTANASDADESNGNPPLIAARSRLADAAKYECIRVTGAL